MTTRRILPKTTTLLTLLLALQLQPASSEPLVNAIESRSITRLDGRWRFIIDPFDNGAVSYRLQPLSNGFWKNSKPRSPSDLVEYDFDRSPLLAVPGDWNSQTPELTYYEGIAWYKHTFLHAGPTENRRHFLYFGAVNYEARVYLNGEEVGRHIGGFTPFNFEVTRLIRKGENHLVVRVDNRRVPEGIPTINSDWWNYGGITRSVLLLETPRVFIRDFVVQLKRGTRDTLAGFVQLSDPVADISLEVGIPDSGVRISLRTDSSGRAVFEHRVSTALALWSPAHPVLHQVILRTADEELSDEIGFRSIQTRGAELLLNGEPLFCKGICIHEEAPDRPARATGQDDARVLLGWARELGCNFVRLAHYPHNEAMVREAERMGILVWSEIPVYWTIHWENPETLANARAQLTDMIVRDRNRAAVIIWSLANETPVSPARTAFLGNLAALARELDNTRLLSAAMEYNERERDHLVVQDPLSEITDVVSFNEYVGWYSGLPDKCRRVTWTVPDDRPVFVSECGGGALQGLHGPPEQRWTEEYQEELYRQTVAMLDRVPNLVGVTPWILKDFRSPRRVLPGIQDGWNRKGLVSDRGVRKKAFDVLREWYENRP